MEVTTYQKSLIGKKVSVKKSARAFFWPFLKKYRKFDFVTQFLRTGSTKIQGFVCHFVENFKLLRENVKIVS